MSIYFHNFSNLLCTKLKKFKYRVIKLVVTSRVQWNYIFISQFHRIADYIHTRENKNEVKHTHVNIIKRSTLNDLISWYDAFAYKCYQGYILLLLYKNGACSKCLQVPTNHEWPATWINVNQEICCKFELLHCVNAVLNIETNRIYWEWKRQNTRFSGTKIMMARM